ncbi:MOSC domain-containing protein [Rhodobium gokarnense]|uniref:MOSC domain-containing protein YiiM n=1 Tax=Rhodobium gokarnense TaxID=364296 RepID=A0ABT3HI30_9HYPH|nr:MOSC domain-containing protein [Rhodobium gokarnense]MCW2310057.1 MOSC domain-containing protein YiiM [Rhodobium gokarnense]
MTGEGKVIAVALSAGHDFSKELQPEIALVAGMGVAGDPHAGVTVKHRSRVRKDPTQPNLRQVHLIHAELFAELAEKGFDVGPADLGENITTAGLDLLALPRGTRLAIGAEAVVAITGLRNPCAQIDGFRKGLLRAVIGRDGAGRPVLKAGVMGIVLAGGAVRPGDAVAVTLPPKPHIALERV